MKKEAQIRLTHIQKQNKPNKEVKKDIPKNKTDQFNFLKVDNRNRHTHTKFKHMNQKERISYPLDKPAIALNLRKGRVVR